MGTASEVMGISWSSGKRCSDNILAQSLGSRTPHEVRAEIEPCSSRPEFTMSRTRAVPSEASTSKG
jgi:hypothetical protein